MIQKENKKFRKMFIVTEYAALNDPVCEIRDFSHMRAAKPSPSLHSSHSQSINIDEGSEHT